MKAPQREKHSPRRACPYFVTLVFLLFKLSSSSHLLVQPLMQSSVQRGSPPPPRLSLLRYLGLPSVQTHFFVASFGPTALAIFSSAQDLRPRRACPYFVTLVLLLFKLSSSSHLLVQPLMQSSVQRGSPPPPPLSLLRYLGLPSVQTLFFVASLGPTALAIFSSARISAPAALVPTSLPWSCFCSNSLLRRIFWSNRSCNLQFSADLRPRRPYPYFVTLVFLLFKLSSSSHLLVQPLLQSSVQRGSPPPPRLSLLRYLGLPSVQTLFFVASLGPTAHAVFSSARISAPAASSTEGLHPFTKCVCELNSRHKRESRRDLNRPLSPRERAGLGT